MAQVLHLPEVAVDYMLYGDNTPFLQNYMQRQMEQLQHLQMGSSPYAHRMLEQLQMSYRDTTDTLRQYNVMHELSRAGVLQEYDFIQPLITFEQLQQAQPIMQRWVMAHPEVRALHLQQNINSYDGTYLDCLPDNGVAEQDYHWRRVMDGVTREEDAGMLHRFYHEQLLEGDRKLEHFEKMDILTTWRFIDQILQDNPYDFTCTSERPPKRGA